MAKKNKEKEKKEAITNPARGLKEEALYGIWSICFFVLTFFFILAAFGKGGPVGNEIYRFFDTLFGLGYYLFPLIFILLGISYLMAIEKRFPLARILGSVLFVSSGLGLLQITSENLGGAVGKIIGGSLVGLFDTYASVAFLVGFLFISCFIIFNTRLKRSHLSTIFGRRKEDTIEKSNDSDINASIEKVEKNLEKNGDLKSKESAEDVRIKEPLMTKKEEAKKKDGEDMLIGPQAFTLMGKKFVPPPLSILEIDKGKPGVGDIKANANIIKRTLQNFGIDVEMDEISIGPSITRYALKPAEGVKLSRILGLQNNLALALAAHPIRIEAPIPGKSLVGIEIPNSVKTTVGLGSLLSSDEFQKSEKPLLASLGKGISGKSHFADIAQMPHALIAGTTGSGKSITIHAIITSLLFRNSPENLRFIMIDPKRVELTQYNKIPHLLTPVITDAKKAILSLKWAAKEMDRRYNLLEKFAVRDIGSYHKTILAPEMKRLEEIIKKNGGTLPEGQAMPETMPYIIIVIDELADIMQTYPRELESGIVRLAQMSRAVGIHLILSTQRPSVNVITGLIKANVPTRIALQVASQIDSRTILDTRGAEELLGAGDMLYLSSKAPNAERIQSAYISENEVKAVVKYLADNYDSLPSEINISGEQVTKDPVFDSISNLDSSLSSEDEADDDLYEEARGLVMKSGKASTSYLQRKLSIGYGRAARIMDILEEKGVIGPSNGSKPREVVGFDPNQQGNSSEEI
jgi:S-DNA-T family DNA segregation ATPase FtsK/SpoIIIE